MDERWSKIVLVIVGFTSVISTLALILAFVGIARNGTNTYYVTAGDIGGGRSGNPSSDQAEDKIWMFHVGHLGSNILYIDESTGIVRGYEVDVTNAVCQVANKNCRLVWDIYENCWDSKAGDRPRGGGGLMGGWYDACVGWYNTFDRARTFAFTKPIEKSYPIGFFTKTGTSFTWPNFEGLKVGFGDGFWIDEHCLASYNPTGFNQDDTEQVFHFGGNGEAVVNALINDEIQVAFLPTVEALRNDSRLFLAHTPSEDKCANGGPAVMMRKDKVELISWWNAAFEQLIATSEYTEICENVKERHGDQPGEDPEDICVLY